MIRRVRDRSDARRARWLFADLGAPSARNARSVVERRRAGQQPLPLDGPFPGRGAAHVGRRCSASSASTENSITAGLGPSPRIPSQAGTATTSHHHALRRGRLRALHVMGRADTKCGHGLYEGTACRATEAAAGRQRARHGAARLAGAALEMQACRGRDFIDVAAPEGARPSAGAGPSVVGRQHHRVKPSGAGFHHASTRRASPISHIVPDATGRARRCCRGDLADAIAAEQEDLEEGRLASCRRPTPGCLQKYTARRLDRLFQHTMGARRRAVVCAAERRRRAAGVDRQGRFRPVAGRCGQCARQGLYRDHGRRYMTAATGDVGTPPQAHLERRYLRRKTRHLARTPPQTANVCDKACQTASPTTLIAATNATLRGLREDRWRPVPNCGGDWGTRERPERMLARTRPRPSA